MVRVSTISYRLDLALRLIDTITGMTISRDIKVKVNGADFFPKIDNDANMVFIKAAECDKETGQRLDFTVEVSAKGYESKTVDVKYDELDENLPYIETHMLPDEKYLPQFPCHTLQGKLSGISEIDAVKISASPCLIKGYESRKLLLTVFNPYKLRLDSVYYAAVNAEEESYQPFIIEKSVSDTVIKVKTGFESPPENCTVSARVIGKAEKNSYTLRVRKGVSDKSKPEKWIVRFVTKKGEFFQTVDFNSLDSGGLIISTAKSKTDRKE
ncbi:MAG: hypothetical protein FWG83_01135 [Oscillospiraceae bacterium]|nr:hypothetical protein [Oscillospiraceae bacterium]